MMLRLKLGDYAFAGCPVTFWDIFGDQGHPAQPSPERPSYPGGYPPPPPTTYPPYQQPRPPRPVGRPRDTLFEAMAKSTVRSIGSSVGRQIVRGVLGSILGGGRR
jgi:hypothetical protein